jgi:type I restriction enzyme S subunit
MIPDEWKVARFSEIADYKVGRTPARANPEYWDQAGNGVPWVSISDMTEFGTVTATKEKISRLAFEQVFRCQAVRAGTFIMSFKLTIGRVATLGVDACHNEAIISIYPKPGVDQRYLGYFLAQVDYDALQDRQVKGNTLNQDKIDRIEVLLPPIDEQSSIANVLDLLRESIDLQDRARATAQELKRAAMRELFTRGLRGEPQKETEIGPVPESWEIKAIGKVFEIVQGLSLKGNLSGGPNGIPFLRTSNVYWGRIELNNLSRMHVSPDLVNNRWLRRGDLLVCEGGEIGRAAVWELEEPGHTYQNHLHRLRPLVSDTVDTKFAAAWLEIGFCHRRLYEGAGNKTTIPNLSRARLSNLLMPVPDIDEQREIVAILDAIDRKIDLHRQKRAVLEELFKALLHKLMTGEIRVADLDLSALEHASWRASTAVEAGV